MGSGWARLSSSLMAFKAGSASDPFPQCGCEVSEAGGVSGFPRPSGSGLTLHLRSPFHQNHICCLTYFPVSGQVGDVYENNLGDTQAR